MGLFEVNEAAEIISDAADTEANVIFGAVVDESLGDQLRVTVIATGFDRLQRADRLAESSVEVVTPKPAGGEVLAPQTHTFEMDEEVLDIPRFLRDKD
jgi:cell division protein FtsZ